MYSETSDGRRVWAILDSLRTAGWATGVLTEAEGVSMVEERLGLGVFELRFFFFFFFLLSPDSSPTSPPRDLDLDLVFLLDSFTDIC
jgi:hypothetical protein